MDYFKSIIKFLLLSIKPFSKLESAFGWGDVMTVVGQLIYYLIFGILITSPISQEAILQWLKNNSLWFLIGLPIFLLIVAGIKLQKENDDYKSKSPNIVFLKGDVSLGAIYKQKQFVPIDQELDRTNVVGSKVCFVYAFVKNDPSGYRGIEKTIKKVASIIDIYDTSDIKKVIISYWGAWRDNPQVVNRPRHMPFTDLFELDELPPNGVPHRIDFALKYYEDEDIYGHNYDSERYSSDGRYAEFKLPREFLVRIKIRAIGLKDEPIGWYEVHHHGKESKPDIRQLSNDEIKNLGR